MDLRKTSKQILSGLWKYFPVCFWNVPFLRTLLVGWGFLHLLIWWQNSGCLAHESALEKLSSDQCQHQELRWLTSESSLKLSQSLAWFLTERFYMLSVKYMLAPPILGLNCIHLYPAYCTFWNHCHIPPLAVLLAVGRLFFVFNIAASSFLPPTSLPWPCSSCQHQ